MKVPSEFGVDDRALTELVIPGDLRRAKEVEDTILDELRAAAYDSDAVFAVKLALEEAFTNAIKHGNREDPEKLITVRFFVDAERAVVMVRDEGQGFRPREVPDPTTDENLERPDGRGLMLMQCYMNAVRYNRRGNEVWLLKKRQPC